MDFTEQPQKVGPCVTVFLEPENKRLVLPRPRTVLQMLNKLGLRPTACLVIRHPQLDGEDCKDGEGAARRVLEQGSAPVLAHERPGFDAAAGSAEMASPVALADAVDAASAPGDVPDVAEERRKLRGSLLTHDLRLFNGDVITVRKVASRG